MARKALSFLLITVSGGVALSALDDLLIYSGCSRNAIEKAKNHKALKDALGEPIRKGPWYNASLAVAHKRGSVACTFPVSGPRGTGVIQLKAIRNGEDDWWVYFRPNDWEILVLEALVYVPENDGKHRTMRINVSDISVSSSGVCPIPVTQPQVSSKDVKQKV